MTTPHDIETVARRGAPYPYPSPLPETDREAHAAAVHAAERRETVGCLIGLVLGSAVAVYLFVSGIVVFEDEGSRRSGAAALLGLVAAVPALLVSLVMRRPVQRHKAVLAAYPPSTDHEAVERLRQAIERSRRRAKTWLIAFVVSSVAAMPFLVLWIIELDEVSVFDEPHPLWPALTVAAGVGAVVCSAIHVRHMFDVQRHQRELTVLGVEP